MRRQVNRYRFTRDANSETRDATLRIEWRQVSNTRASVERTQRRIAHIYFVRQSIDLRSSMRIEGMTQPPKLASRTHVAMLCVCRHAQANNLAAPDNAARRRPC